MSNKRNMTISDLKRIIGDLPEDMPVIIPVISEDNVDQIFGFRFVRTAGILSCEFEEDSRVLCLNGSNEYDIADQVRHRDVTCECILFGDRDKYIKVPENHIVIDFDIPDESGAGIHLHYIYNGDISRQGE